MKATHLTSVALFLAASLAFGAHANTDSHEPVERPVDALKRLYLVCDRAAMNGTLNAGGAAFCSTIYEDLKRRVFGGDFEKLTQWAKTQQAMQNVGDR